MTRIPDCGYLRVVRRFMCIVLLVCCLGPRPGAAAPDFAGDGGKASVEAPPERRTPSFFHRPKKGTPTEQLAYARSLAAQGRFSLAVRQYLALVHAWHDSNEAPVAVAEAADIKYRRGDYQGAFDEYDYLIRYYAGRFPYSEALDRQFKIANRVMTTRERFLWVLPGASPLAKALPLFERIAVNGPEWERAADAQFNIGTIHEGADEYELAIVAYETVQQKYPKADLAVSAAFREGYCLYRLAGKYAREERYSQRARLYVRRLIEKHPESASVAEAGKWLEELETRLAGMAYDRALFYDRRGRNASAAVITYEDFLKKFPDTEMAAVARARVDELREAAARNDSAGETTTGHKDSGGAGGPGGGAGTGSEND